MATEALNELCPLCLCPRHGRDFLRIAASGEWKHRAPYDCIYAMGKEIEALKKEADR